MNRFTRFFSFLLALANIDCLAGEKYTLSRLTSALTTPRLKPQQQEEEQSLLLVLLRGGFQSADLKNRTSPKLQQDRRNTFLSRLTSKNSAPTAVVEAAVDHRLPAWREDKLKETARFWKLSASEQKALAQLGDRLSDLDYHKNKPSEVVRFLLNRYGDVDAAEAKFRETVRWRLENKIDTFLQDYRPPQELLDRYPLAILKGLDKDGDPIFLTRTGSTDGVFLLDRFGREELLKHQMWMKEMIWNGPWVKKFEREHGRPLTRLTVIDDVHGIPYMQYAKNKKLLSAYAAGVAIDKHYPEPAKKIFLVRVPTLFKVIWGIVSTFFDKALVQRVAICNSKNYQKVLSELVDLRLLPDSIVPGIGQRDHVPVREGFQSTFHGGHVPEPAQA